MEAAIILSAIIIACSLFVSTLIKVTSKTLSDNSEIIYLEFKSKDKVIEVINAAIKNLGGNQICDFAGDSYLEFYEPNQKEPYFTSKTTFIMRFSENENNRVLLKLVLDEDCLLLLWKELEQSNVLIKYNKIGEGISYYTHFFSEV